MIKSFDYEIQIMKRKVWTGRECFVNSIYTDSREEDLEIINVLLDMECISVGIAKYWQF